MRARPRGEQRVTGSGDARWHLPEGKEHTHCRIGTPSGSTRRDKSSGVTSLPAMLGGGSMPAEPAGASQVSQQSDNSFAGSGACGNVYEFILLALGVPSFTASNSIAELARVLGLAN